MAENSLIINATSPLGDKIQRTVTYTNDEADRDKLLTFAQGINALSTNNFLEAKRVQKVDLDTEPDGGWHGGSDIGYDVIPYPEAATAPDEDKESPTITLTPATVTTTALEQAFASADYYEVTVSYNGDGVLYTDYQPDWQFIFGVKIVGDKLRVYHNAVDTAGFTAGTVTVRSTTTDNCNPASATFTVTRN